MSKETVTLILKVIQIIELLYKAYKQHQREELINEIKSKPAKSWNDKFASNERDNGR